MGDSSPRESEILFYAAPDGAVRVGVLFRDETAWLTQKSLAELFGVKVPAINKHIKNIFKSDGKAYRAQLYSLDAIIAVGYRVNSYQATQFRIWATQTLREFITKGFVLDDERLKQGKTVFGKDYFDDLLERIREIRASERRFYQKVTDIYALSADYDSQAPTTREFFATVQNKLHWAITGQTAAELIYSSADATRGPTRPGATPQRRGPPGVLLAPGQRRGGV
ncbi:virulence RhuM family protein [bacterium]|nr:virulence RhuM family protein [bacterium]